MTLGEASQQVLMEGAEKDVWNAVEALANAAGSEALMRRVCQVFLENLPAMQDAIHTAVANRDIIAIQHSAHTLKGSASVIGAQAATAAARDLEMMAKSRKLDGVGIALDHLDCELKRLIREVAELESHPEAVLPKILP